MTEMQVLGDLIDRRLVGERPDSKGEYLFPFRAKCTHKNDGWGCSFEEVFYTAKAATWALEHHEHFKTYQQRRYNYLSIAELIWVELDHVIDRLKVMQGHIVTDTAKEELLKVQGRATGLAFAIVKACHPYYPDEKAVSIEANRRWKMRNGQLDWAPTLGFKYSPPPLGRRETVTVDEPVAVPRSRRAADPAAEAAKKLKPAEIDAIKQGVNSGMFQIENLARVYGVTASVIQYVAKS